MSEVALQGHRGFYASFQYVTLIGGQLLAVARTIAVTGAASGIGAARPRTGSGPRGIA